MWLSTDFVFLLFGLRAGSNRACGEPTRSLSTWFLFAGGLFSAVDKALVDGVAGCVGSLVGD